jgi:hypothetical protein
MFMEAEMEIQLESGEIETIIAETDNGECYKCDEPLILEESIVDKKENKR